MNRYTTEIINDRAYGIWIWRVIYLYSINSTNRNNFQKIFGGIIPCMDPHLGVKLNCSPTNGMYTIH